MAAVVCVCAIVAFYTQPIMLAALPVQVACTGGGSNFGGLTFPILREKMAGRMITDVTALK
jgi:predicted alternative tryptophan synthase beta-subunit